MTELKFHIVRDPEHDDTPVERTAEERVALQKAKDAMTQSIEKAGGTADLPGIEDGSWHIEELS